MRFDEKPPGLTLAEALGIEVPENAPGGQRIAPPVGGERLGSRESRRRADAIAYDGFHDVDAYGMGDE